MSDSQPSILSRHRKGNEWYDLFSRGARDWLRHNEKVRDAVKQHLPELVSDLNIVEDSVNRTVRVPVRFLEHYRFILSRSEDRTGVGQGDTKPGSIIQTDEGTDGSNKGRKGSGSGEGAFEFILELKIDDIVDWFWEELKLPNLKAKIGSIEEDEYTREGWNRRGVRARLDRRRTVKESIKRRIAHPSGPTFTNEDLRFRQLVKHRQPMTEAVVFFCLDVSSSMTEHDRKLAKSFFFWTLQGLRRQYQRIDTVFVAHTVSAWEFSEEEFFQVSAHGGTIASVAFRKVNEIIEQRFDPARYNIYLFYASDGENFPQDYATAKQAMKTLLQVANFAGYIETVPAKIVDITTNTSQLFEQFAEKGFPVATFPLHAEDDVWVAIRSFFQLEVASNSES